MTMLSARIPFAGFYESLWSSEIDYVQEMILCEDDEYRFAECYPQLATIPEPERDLDRLRNAVWFKFTDIRKAEMQIALDYAERFASWLAESLDLKEVPVEFEEMTSPREYNFTTDRVFAKLPESVFELIRERLGVEKVAAHFEEMFTSRSGFHSYYDNEPPEKPLAEWDHNELYALLSGWVDQATDGDSIDFMLFEGMADAVYYAVEGATDFAGLEAEADEIAADWLAEKVDFDPTFVPPVPRCKYTQELPFNR